MPVLTEYAKVVDGVVVAMIVASQEHVDTRDDGPWVLTPYDGVTGKVGLGYTYNEDVFAVPALPEPPPEPAP